MPAPPKRLYSLWLQGQAAAPEMVRICFAKWRQFNPDHELTVLDANDVVRLLGGTGLPFREIAVQALSDIVRARLLQREGGVWIDATVMPVAPLDTWLPKATAQTGFFAFERPAADRPLSSWFLAAEPNHPVMEAWWGEIERFWSKPRQLADHPGGIPPDPVAAIAPDRGGAGDFYPYYWFHYLFQYLLDTRPEIAAIWRNTARRPADPAHAMQMLFGGGEPPGLYQVMAAASGSPVHKLNWRAPYPLDMLAALGGPQLPVFPA